MAPADAQSILGMTKADVSSKPAREPAGGQDTDTPYVFLDMGTYNLKAFPELSHVGPGAPALQGLQIMQMMPRGLENRASHFVAFSGAEVSSQTF